MGRWLSYRGIRDRYSLSESTVRRLIADARWPKGEQPTPGRKVFSEEECDKAFARLIARGRTEAA